MNKASLEARQLQGGGDDITKEIDNEPIVIINFIKETRRKYHHNPKEEGDEDITHMLDLKLAEDMQIIREQKKLK